MAEACQDGLGSCTGRTVEAGSDLLEYEYFPQLATVGVGLLFITVHTLYLPMYTHAQLHTSRAGQTG